MNDDTKKLINEEVAPAAIEESAKHVLAHEIPLIGPLAKVWTFFTGRNDRRADAAFREEMDDITAELCKRIEVVEEKVRGDGKDPERLSPLAARRVVKELFEAIEQTLSVEKKEALINLASRMTDPTINLTLRRWLWRTLQAMTDTEYDIFCRCIGAGVGSSTFPSSGMAIDGSVLEDIARKYPPLLRIDSNERRMHRDGTSDILYQLTRTPKPNNR